MWQSQNLPLPFTQKKLFLSKFIISFAQLLSSHGLGAICFDVSFFYFSLLEDRRYYVFFISFMSLSKFIILDDVFLFNGFIMICIVTREPKQGSLSCKYR